MSYTLYCVATVFFVLFGMLLFRQSLFELRRHNNKGTLIGLLVGSILFAYVAWLTGREAYIIHTIKPEMVSRKVVDLEHRTETRWIGKVLTTRAVTKFYISGFSSEFKCDGHQNWKAGNTKITLSLFRDPSGKIVRYEVIDSR